MDSSQWLYVHPPTAKQLMTLMLDEPDRVYFPDDLITGQVVVSQTLSHLTCTVNIHMECMFQLRNGSYKQPQFKVLLSPQAPKSDNRVVFQLRVPPQVPSSVDDETVPARIVFKVKAIVAVSDLQVSLWPKASAPVKIVNRLPIKDPALLSALASEKEYALVIPRDMTFRLHRLRKGDKRTVSAKLSMSCSGFLAGRAIPFSLHVKHVVPVKLLDGIHVCLERVTHVLSQNNTTMIDSTNVFETKLPLICDPDTFSATIASKAKVPKDTVPTSHASPLQVFYRLRIYVLLDTSSLVEEATLRKRDKAYSMMKMVGSWQDPSNGKGLSAPILALELPITIGTTEGEPPTYANRFTESFISLSIDKKSITQEKDDTGGDEDEDEATLLTTPPAYSTCQSRSATPSVVDVPTRQPTAPTAFDILEPADKVPTARMSWPQPLSQESQSPKPSHPPQPPNHWSVYSE